MNMSKCFSDSKKTQSTHHAIYWRKKWMLEVTIGGFNQQQNNHRCIHIHNHASIEWEWVQDTRVNLQLHRTKKQYFMIYRVMDHNNIHFMVVKIGQPNGYCVLFCAFSSAIAWSSQLGAVYKHPHTLTIHEVINCRSLKWFSFFSVIKFGLNMNLLNKPSESLKTLKLCTRKIVDNWVWMTVLK